MFAVYVSDQVGTKRVGRFTTEEEAKKYIDGKTEHKPVYLKFKRSKEFYDGKITDLKLQEGTHVVLPGNGVEVVKEPVFTIYDELTEMT